MAQTGLSIHKMVNKSGVDMPLFAALPKEERRS